MSHFYNSNTGDVVDGDELDADQRDLPNWHEVAESDVDAARGWGIQVDGILSRPGMGTDRAFVEVPVMHPADTDSTGGPVDEDDKGDGGTPPPPAAPPAVVPSPEQVAAQEAKPARRARPTA